MLGSAFPAIVVWGPELVQIYNDAYAPLIGSKHPDALGMPTHECWPEIADVQRPIFARVFSGETVSLSQARYLLDRRGTGEPEEAWFDATFIPVHDETGGIGGSLSILFECTGLVRAREGERSSRAALETAYQRADAANRAKSDFLAVMSHELRTPLNAISGYVDLLSMELRGPLTDEQRTDLGRIKDASSHLMSLVSDVLSYVPLEMGHVRYEIGPVHLEEALSRLEVLIAPQFHAKRIGYHVSYCQADLVVRADAEKLQRVLTNLLTNALKYTDAGGRVTVTCDADEQHVSVSVTDTGIGIPPEKLPLIFDAFVQVEQPLTRRQGGVGLGLAISRELARGMDGDLTATSALGKGSTFVLRLPRVR